MNQPDKQPRHTAYQQAHTAHSSEGSPENVGNARGDGPMALLRDILHSADLRRVLPGILLSSFLANLLALSLPLAILLLLDKIIVNRSYETLIIVLLGVMAALCLEEVLRLTNSRVTSWVGARFEHAESINALDRLLRAPLRLLRKDEPCVHVNRILSTTKVSEFYSGQALLVIFDLPFTALFLAMIWFIGGSVALVPLALLTLFTLISLKFGATMRDRIHRRTAQDDRRYNFINEVFRGIHSVKLLVMERMMLRRYERLQETNVEHGSKLAYGSIVASELGQRFSQVMIVAVIMYGASLVIAGEMTPGGLAACMMLSVRSLQPLRRGLSAWLRYQSFVDSQRRLDELKSLPEEVPASSPSAPAMPPVRESIALRNIALAANQEKTDYLFKDISLHLPAKSCTVILGDSGSGKSSLLALMSGTYHPDAGQVLVDDRPLMDFTEESVHKEIALLPQRGSMFAGTIMDNMTLFDSSRIEKALELSERLGLDNVVAGMRLGYDTMVGDGINQTLPSGVTQQVSIIRALLSDPGVILFDEANMDLDMQGDRHLIHFLAEEKGQRTLVLVTQRPSLISLADRIYTLQDGRLAEGRLPNPEPRAATDAESCFGLFQDDSFSSESQSFLDMSPFFKEQSDLALCLQPLLKSLDWRGEANELAEALPHMGITLDITGFRSAMANLGYMCMSVQGKLSELDERLLPCLFVPKNRPARVVLRRNPDGSFLVFDADQNGEAVIKPSREKGEMIFFRPLDTALETQIQEKGWLRALGNRFKWHLALTLAISLISTILTLAPPFFVMAVYNNVLPTGNMRVAFSLLAGVIIALVLSFFLRRFKFRLIAFMTGRAEYLISNAVFQRILQLPVSATQSSSSGRQFMRLKSFESLRDFFLGPFPVLAFDLPGIFILVIVIGLLNPWALPALGVAALLFLILGLLAHWPQRRLAQNSSQHATQRWEFLMEATHNTHALRTVGALPLWLKRFRELSGSAVHSAFQTQWMNAKVSGAARLIGMLTGLSVLGISVVAAMHDWMSVGALIATKIIVWRLVGPMQNTLMAAGTLTRVSGTLRQLDTLMRLPLEDKAAVLRTRRPKTHGTLNFARASFRYSNDADPALLGVSFTVRAGRMLAVTGPNGSGKTTLLKLILRAYSPQAGAVKLDDVDLRQIPVADLRSRISYMPQACELFYGTIEQNLRFTHPTAGPEEICWAVSMTGFSKDVESFPEGLQSRISANSAAQLPSGFRQRLSLTRTMLKPAPVMLLDEPETGMDFEGNLAVIRCLEYLKRISTVIIVSHRPSYMRLADAVLYLESGVIKKIGPFDQINEIIMASQTNVKA